MHRLCHILLFLLPMISVGQESIRFSAFYDSNGGAGLVESIVLLDNGTIMGVGSNLNPSNGNNQDGHHLLVDSNGTLLSEFAITYLGMTYNSQALIKTSSGALFTAGYHCDYTIDSPGYCDYYISRLNEFGDTIFTSIIERPDTSDLLLDLIETRPNKLMLIGWTYDDTTNTDADLMFITVDTLGNELNRVVWGGGGTDYVHSGITIDSFGNTLMVGYTKSFPSINNGRSWVLKTDSIGNVLWYRTYSGIGASTANGIRARKLSDGNIIISGGKSGNGYLQKIDTSGNEIWIKLYDVPGGQGLWGVSELPNGTLVSCGVTDGPSGSQAGWLIKTDEFGDTLWTRTYDSSDFTDYLRNMLVLPNGDIVMVGFGRGENSTTQDGWILRVDSMGCLEEGCWTVGINEVKNDFPLLIYPNPATTNLTIESRTPLAQVWVRDVAGRVVLPALYPSRTSGYPTIDVSGLPSGIYLVEALTKNGQRSVQKVVVE